MIRCSISNDFETDKHEAVLDYLGRYFDNAKRGMTAEKYLDMCERMGDTPDPEMIPPDLQDFPPYVVMGMEMFNTLTDTFTGGMSPVFCGKDLSALPVLFDIYLVEQSDKIKILDVIKFLDNRAIKQAVKEAEKANKKAARK